MKPFFALLLALTLFSPQAHAFMIDYIDYNQKWLIDDAYNRAMSQARKDMEPGSGRSSGPNVKTDILWTGAQTMAGKVLLEEDVVQRMAGMVPSSQRKQAEVLFTQIISSFNDSVEKLYGVPKENVATGVVALLAGGYAAYYNKTFPDRFVKPTVQQVGDFLRKRPELFVGKATYKRQSYQTAVSMGVLLQLLQQEVQKSGNAEDAAKLKQAGARIFQAVLGVAPEQVDFSTSGIRFR